MQLDANGAAAIGATPRKGIRGRPGVVLTMLTFVYVLNFLDRQLLGILAKPIQDELQVTDGQLGLIGGLYFAMFYCFIAIPVAWLADRTNRVAVLSIACAIWSAATIACGLARTYPELVVARMTVGFGEAGGVPPSYALITDTFRPGRRGFAFGIYNLGPPIGAALGIGLGASIAAAFDWRDAFIAIGAVGVLAAIALPFLVAEPQRGSTDPDAPAINEKAPFWATVRTFFGNRTLTLTAFGTGATQFVTYGLGNFAVLFLMREKGMTLEEVAVWYALVVIVGMGGGMLASGQIIDRMTARSRRWFGALPAGSLAISMPFYIAFVWTPSWPLALVLLTIVNFFNYFYLSCAVTLTQEESAPNQRVLAGALLLLIANFIGLGLGPTWVGAASDWIAARGQAENSLELALYTLAPFYLVAIGLFVLLARRLRRLEEAAK